MTVERRRRPATRVLPIVVVIALGVMVVGALWVGHTYGTFDPLVPPPKLAVFGGDFRPSEGRVSTRDEVVGTRPGADLDIFEPAIGAWPVVAPWTGSAVQPEFDMPTVVWLRVGPDAYQAYELSGGP